MKFTFPLKEKQGLGGNGPVLDFASRSITASYMVTLTSVGPDLSFIEFGELRPRHRKGFAQDLRVSLQESQG